MKYAPLALLLLIAFFALNGCDSNQISQSVSGHGIGVIGVGGNTEESGSSGEGLTPLTTNTTTGNPHNCPADTVIRSDCSVQSQIDCDCMLP